MENRIMSRELAFSLVHQPTWTEFPLSVRPPLRSGQVQDPSIAGPVLSSSYTSLNKSSSSRRYFPCLSSIEQSLMKVARSRFEQATVL